MSTSRKPRQLRGQFTGGVDDLQDFYSRLMSTATSLHFDPTYYEVKPFGVHGPIHKLTFGFTEVLDGSEC